MKIIPTKSKDNLCEGVFGTPRWCLCNATDDGDIQQLHTPAVCKDYSHEIVVVNKRPDLYEKLFPVYGMEYDIEKYPLNPDALIISYEGGTDNQHVSFDSNMKLLEELHDMGDVEVPLVSTRLNEGSIVIQGDKFWLSSPLHISFFLVFIRAMTRKKNAKSVEELVALENINGVLRLPWGVSGFINELSEIMHEWESSIRDDIHSKSIHNFGTVAVINSLLKNKGYVILLSDPVYDCVTDWLKKTSKELKVVFVYGTLKKGFGNHSLLSRDPFATRQTEIRYKMVDLGGNFPGLIKSSFLNNISGELYLIDKADEVRLDRLEGYPSFYGKDTIEIGSIEAIVYTLPEEYSKYKTVKEGTWTQN